MSSPVERRYRRLLHLLPVGYRHRWEEDMVAAFMEGARASGPYAVGERSDRLPLAERLSVVALAVRLRLNGSHATPRGLVWYHVMHGLALIVLLYQALAATVSVALGVQHTIVFTVDAGLGTQQHPLILHFFLWSRVFGLLWVAAFLCLVFSRLIATRVFVVLALAATIGVTAATYLIVGSASAAGVPFGLADISRWGWLALTVAIVFVYPPHARASRWLWFGAYLIGSVILVPTTLLAMEPYRRPWVPLAHLVNVSTVASAALIIAMAAALLMAVPGRRPSPQWLLTFAAFAGGFGGIRLMAFLTQAGPSSRAPYATVPTTLNAILLGLAVACAVVGLLALGHLPGGSRSQGDTVSVSGSP